MKRTISFTIALLVLTASIVAAQDPPDFNDIGDLNREAAVKAFEQLKKNAQQGLRSPEAVVKGADGTLKFGAIAPVEVPYADNSGSLTGATNAVKVWFELSDGRFVNPKFYRWAPNEIFYVHIESAVPVFVTIYQNYPGISQSKRAYPDERFPNSFRAVKPGEGTRLPVAFQMDGNHNSEFMSIVVTKADWEGLSQEVPQAASVAAAVAVAGNQQAIAAAYAGVVKGGADISKESTLTKFAAVNDAGLNDAEYSDGETKCRRVRYYVSYPRYIRPVYYCRYVNRSYNYIRISQTTNINFINYRGCYTDLNEAAVYLFSDNGVGQLQLTLRKCGPHWQW